MSNWVQLTSGGGYDFEEKRIFGPFSLENDVAWPLTAPRFGNHLSRRKQWPVALHSVAVALTIEDVTENLEAAAAGLLHDIHEAVIGDITTPVGRHIDYDRVKELKHDVHAAMYLRLGISFDLLPDRDHKNAINEADLAALHVERRMWTAPEPRPWGLKVPDHKWMEPMYRHTLELENEDPEERFLYEYRRLVQPLLVQ